MIDSSKESVRNIRIMPPLNVIPSIGEEKPFQGFYLYFVCDLFIWSQIKGGGIWGLGLNVIIS